MRALLHDIRNFVGAIVGSLSLYQAEGMSADKRQKLIENAFRSALDLKTFVDQKSVTIKDSDEHQRRRVTDGMHPIKDLNDKKGLFLAAIEKTRMPMIVTDPHQKDNPIIFANEAFIHTTGYDLNELIGNNCRFLQGKDTDPATVQDLRDAIENRTEISVEIQNYRKDGSAFWNALFVSPIFDVDGQLLYFFGSQLDITRRREAEIALRKGQKLEAIGQLTGGIAHDFNNLLQLILGNLAVARETDDYEVSNRHLEAVSQAAVKARNLTQQLLAFSRKQPLAAKITSLNRVVADTKELLGKTLGEQIAVETKLALGVKNVQVDTVQLEMAILNVLVNAKDAMSGNGKVLITTEACTFDRPPSNLPDVLPGRYSKLSIMDNGKGMSPDVLAHAIEPFFTTKDVGKGTGLGLAQVFGFVKQSKGHLLIESTENVGTCVSFLFPAVDVASVQTMPLIAPLTKQEGRGERILIVEDNREVQELAKHILEHDGYVVETANNAAEARERIEKMKDQFDLIFSDILMPGGANGLDLVESFQVKSLKCGVLLTTGYSDDAMPNITETKFEIIYKPYMPVELTQKVRQVLNRRMDHGN